MTGRQQAILAGAAVGLAAWGISRRHDSFAGQVVIITGGSRGLGLEMARHFAAEGATLAICSRTQADVERACEELRRTTETVMGLACDVTNRGQVREFIQKVARSYGRIDVLVNNAGIIQAGPLECMTDQDFRNALATHFWGPYHAIQAAMPWMRRQGGGRIVNIASIGGKMPVPHMAPYCASKFALVGLSMALRTELSRHGISVTTVNPGLMRTGSARNALFKGRHRAEYAWFAVSSALPVITMSSTRAARQIVEACRHRRAELTLTIPAKLAARSFALTPGLFTAALALANRLLPRPGGIGKRSVTGRESTSFAAPSILTLLADRAAIRNLENR